jgi:hypothetical protein
MTFITELRAENFKRIKAVRIKPDGHMVALSGRNGQGKSSVLDAIAAAIEGMASVTTDPIRKGSEKAWIEIELSDKRIRRTFSRRRGGEPVTTTLTVETKDGAILKSPQAVLNSLYADISFDAGAFLGLESAKQVETLRRFVRGVDFDSIDKAIKATTAERLEVGRKVKEYTAAAKAIVVPDGLPDVPIDEAELIQRMGAAAQINTGIALERADRNKKAAAIERLESIIADDTTEIERLKGRLAHLENQLVKFQADRDRMAEELKALPPLAQPVDVTEVSQQIMAARDINAAIAKRVERDRLASAAAAQTFQYEDLTSSIEDQIEAKRKAIEEAEMPVPGLGFNDDGVTLNGHPFEDASQAERIRTAVAIGMAANPTLRVVRIRDGSLLDADAMKIVAEMAEAHDFQVWIERVSDGGATGFVIEDGELVGAEAA